MKYAGFWVRLFSLIIDSIFFMFALFAIAFSIPFTFSLKAMGISFLIFSLLTWVIYLFLLTKYGGSPGKLLVGIKVLKLNGEHITFREAILRSIVDLLFAILFWIIWIYAINMAGNLNPEDLTFWKMSTYLKPYYPHWHGNFEWIKDIWFWGELIVLLFNNKRRAIHDFIAGTIVVHNK